MIKKLSLAILSLFIVLTCVSCANKGEEIEKNNKTGSRMTLSFLSNPTTGYDWAYEMGQGAGEIELISTDFTSSASEEFMGAAGIRNFIFKGTKSGTQTITFIYKRNWEGGETAYDVVYTVEVDDKLSITFLDKQRGIVETDLTLDMFPDPTFSE